MHQEGERGEAGTFWASSSKFVLSITSWRICTAMADVVSGTDATRRTRRRGDTHKEGHGGGNEEGQGS